MNRVAVATLLCYFDPLLEVHLAGHGLRLWHARQSQARFCHEVEAIYGVVR